ncbi:hypothetical protein [Quadrisphaera sp. DSM 44207]|uniref:hypothetical protein n=1 Tax=Quadrisphaera sp. DSM 44207 TaxID=1881057 RepID=UPI0008914DE6|nr:hypothetical protein [Quadrisphaera sp. DSM 44207]SDQ04248.1 hypothetical protein SAMN05428996_0101 [Quadrisphaera sp. DSM 44207]
MGLLDRLRNRAVIARTQGLRPALKPPVALVPKSRRVPVDAAEEVRLRERLEHDPNDEQAFRRLADIVRRRAAEGHEGGDPQRAADDAVWALAEETARNGRAWYALVELGRLSVHEDREGALRRLGTAAERDHSGQALAESLAVLREAGLPDDALGLGVGHWRPREHVIDAGRHLVHAAVEAGRIAEARRHLQAFDQFPDQQRVAGVRAELERAITEADQRKDRFSR